MTMTNINANNMQHSYAIDSFVSSNDKDTKSLSKFSIHDNFTSSPSNPEEGPPHLLRRFASALSNATKQKIGDYVLGKYLGGGGFGSVYQGYHDAQPGEEVALKIQRTKPKEPTFKLFPKRFNRKNARPCDPTNVSKEIKLLAACRHKNVIRLIDAFKIDEAIVIVTERADESLSKFIKGVHQKGGRGQLTLFEQLMKGILSGVEFLHSHGVCHKDIKPCNVLIKSSASRTKGRDYICANDIRLCDFGLSRASSEKLWSNARICQPQKGSSDDSTDGDGYLQDLSHAPHKDIWCHKTSGTPSYMAPEINGSRYEGRNADLWAIGCIMLWMYYSFPCLDISKGKADLVLQLSQQKCIWNYVEPDELDLTNDLIASFLEKDPSKRPTAPMALKHPWMSYWSYLQCN